MQPPACPLAGNSSTTVPLPCAPYCSEAKWSVLCPILGCAVVDRAERKVERAVREALNGAAYTSPHTALPHRTLHLSLSRSVCNICNHTYRRRDARANIRCWEREPYVLLRREARRRMRIEASGGSVRSVINRGILDRDTGLWPRWPRIWAIGTLDWPNNQQRRLARACCYANTSTHTHTYHHRS